MNILLALFASLLAATGMGGGTSGSVQQGSTDNNGASAGRDTEPEPVQSSDTFSALTSPETAFYSEDGVLVLEAESANASGAWESRFVDGERVMLWDAETNSYNKAQDDEALSFEFVAEESGTYFIAIHGGRVSSAMDAADVRNDTGNDSFVRVTNLETGEVVLDPTKLFIGLGDADEDLRWGKTFDKDHVKSDAQVALEKETAYRIDLIGRSDGHMIDRVTLAKDGFLRDTEIEESGFVLEQLALPAVFVSDLPMPQETDEEMLDIL